MKKSLLIFCSISMLCFLALGFTSPEEKKKVTICHIPPGNPDNCHEITICIEAIDNHMNHHGDSFICNYPEDEPLLQQLSKVTGIPVKKNY